MFPWQSSTTGREQKNFHIYITYLFIVPFVAVIFLWALMAHHEQEELCWGKCWKCQACSPAAHYCSKAFTGRESWTGWYQLSVQFLWVLSLLQTTLSAHSFLKWSFPSRGGGLTLLWYQTGLAVLYLISLGMNALCPTGGPKVALVVAAPPVKPTTKSLPGPPH